jgi:hypothetical protein
VLGRVEHQFDRRHKDILVHGDPARPRGHGIVHLEGDRPGRDFLDHGVKIVGKRGERRAAGGIPRAVFGQGIERALGVAGGVHRKRMVEGHRAVEDHRSHTTLEEARVDERGASPERPSPEIDARITAVFAYRVDIRHLFLGREARQVRGQRWPAGMKGRAEGRPESGIEAAR